MPVEIRELVIRAVVDPSAGKADAASTPKDADREALIQACVEEVLRILRREKGR